MCDSVLQSISDVESFNLCVRHLKECAPGVVLLGPEGYTSSKLPARLDARERVELKTFQQIMEEVLRVGVLLNIPRSLSSNVECATLNGSTKKRSRAWHDVKQCLENTFSCDYMYGSALKYYIYWYSLYDIAREWEFY